MLKAAWQVSKDATWVGRYFLLHLLISSDQVEMMIFANVFMIFTILSRELPGIWPGEG